MLQKFEKAASPLHVQKEGLDDIFHFFHLFTVARFENRGHRQKDLAVLEQCVVPSFKNFILVKHQANIPAPELHKPAATPLRRNHQMQRAKIPKLLGSTLVGGMKRDESEKKLSVLDAMHYIASSWHAISKDTINFQRLCECQRRFRRLRRGDAGQYH